MNIKLLNSNRVIIYNEWYAIIDIGTKYIFLVRICSV